MSQESRADVSGSAETPPEKKYLSVRQAAFIGVGAMVGRGSSRCSARPAR